MNKKHSNRKWPRARYIVFLFLVIVTFAVVAGTTAQEGTPGQQDSEVTVLEEVVGPNFVSTTIQVTASDDTFVSSTLPSSNFGRNSNLRIGFDPVTYGAERVLMRFNIGAIPSGAIIDSATFQLYQNGATPIPDPYFGGQFGIEARFLASSWSESTVTWNSHTPTWGDVIGVGSTAVSSGLKNADATDVVRQWYSGSRPNYGVSLQGDESPDRGRQRIFDSKDKSGGIQPVLIVTYTIFNDTCPPSTSVDSLPTWSPAVFTVSWFGNDCGSGGQPPSGISHYDVDYSIDNSNWTQWIRSTTNTSSSFNGDNGVRYYFRARAVDKAGNVGAWSSSKNTRVDSIAPTASINVPGIAGVEGYNFPSFQVFWNGADNLSGLNRFEGQFREAGGSWSERDFPPSQTSEWVTGATVGKTYELRIRSVDNAGNASGWDTATTVIVNDPSSLVLPFSKAIIQDGNELPFTVKWLGFSSSTITNFEVRYRVNGGPWTKWNDFAGTVSTAQFDPSIIIPGWDPDEIWTIDFEVAATANNQLPETFTGQPEATITVDLSGKLQPVSYIPIVFQE